MSTIEELIGSDILIDDQGNFVRAPDGDAEIVTEYDCLIQEIRNEMNTQPGDLFYDKEYGYGLLEFIQKQNNEINRLEFTQRIKTKLSRNEFISPDSIKVNISNWDLKAITTSVKFRILDKEIELALTVADRVNVEVVNV
ncbi:contractile injection system sheath initiator [Maledivibacter halophilus]|uniref:Phage baseplate assembly protein W n=1 Tax=Maledivibacter halophilus TaxID=36842 RepID=A0A1T5KWH8_9FIRM|nr:DUF2634 domain-containing protein [Maledivibacter halophilus]SKC68077.1 Protein of unknown function [Maledivibacter halophilus]SKC71867.1 Protein of unknown function [Maledivibacter halophilus]SKC80118.1 Protein of unknown function [Maledivibacter halophilus]